MLTDNGSLRLPAPADGPVGSGRRGEHERRDDVYGTDPTWNGSDQNESDQNESDRNGSNWNGSTSNTSSASAPLGVSDGRNPDE